VYLVSSRVKKFTHRSSDVSLVNLELAYRQLIKTVTPDLLRFAEVVQ
jgi:hypothetical protein